jgi:hypothetical protein
MLIVSRKASTTWKNEEYCWAHTIRDERSLAKSNLSRFLHCRDDCRETKGWFMSHGKIGADKVIKVMNGNRTQPLIPLVINPFVRGLASTRQPFHESGEIVPGVPICDSLFLRTSKDIFLTNTQSLAPLLPKISLVRLLA